MQCRFVQLTKENILHFSDLYASVFNAAPWNDGWSVAAVAERFESFSKYPTFFGVGHIMDETPSGLAFGWSERWVDDWHFHLKEMCVAPNAQRQGFGGKLLSELEQRLIGQGIGRVFLETGKSTPARNFYEKQGYRQLSLVSLSKAIEA